MLVLIGIFVAALLVLLVSARFFTNAAEAIGFWLKLPSFVIGIFIVGIGTSLPELISGILSVQKGVSEILPGNVFGSNISNILLITGLAVVINRKNITFKSNYLFIDLHFLIGSFFYLCVIAYDGKIEFMEAGIGFVIFIIYSIYLIKGEPETKADVEIQKAKVPFPSKHFLLLIASGVGIYFGADYTVYAMEKIGAELEIPNSIIALTVLSLGTTLPELAVNITAIRQGKAEMALGNVLGSCIFNSLMVPTVASLFGDIHVPANLIGFSLPVMAGAGILFYLLTQDKKISVWEGLLFVSLYVLFIIKTAT